jgi:enterobactin synthetase component D
MTPFSASEFKLARFADAGIACPPTIRNAVQKRQAEYFYGRICARCALANLGLREIVVGTGPARQPVWPVGIIGSITHTDRLAAAVTLQKGRHRGVGIDIECYSDDAALASVATIVLTSRELELLRHRGSELSESALLCLAFSAKESFYKAVYNVVQRFVDFSAIELDMLDIKLSRIGFTLTETLSTEWQCGARGELEFALLDEQHLVTGVLF